MLFSDVFCSLFSHIMFARYVCRLCPHTTFVSYFCVLFSHSFSYDMLTCCYFPCYFCLQLSHVKNMNIKIAAEITLLFPALWLFLIFFTHLPNLCVCQNPREDSLRLRCYFVLYYIISYHIVVFFTFIRTL